MNEALRPKFLDLKEGACVISLKPFVSAVNARVTKRNVRSAVIPRVALFHTSFRLTTSVPSLTSRRRCTTRGVYRGVAVVAITTFTKWTAKDMPKLKNGLKPSTARPLAALAHASDLRSRIYIFALDSRCCHG